MRRLLNLLIPSEKIFFELLSEQSKHVLEGARLLNNSLESNPIKPEDIELMKKIEKAGDIARHKTVLKLNQSLITPYDREDIHELSSVLDDVLDATEKLMCRFKTYNNLTPSKDIKEVSKILLETVEELHLTVIDLPKGGTKLLPHCRRIGELEEKADIYYRAVLEKLFRKKNAKQIIVEKELIEFAEDAIDKCQKAAIVIEGIIIKST